MTLQSLEDPQIKNQIFREGIHSYKSTSPHSHQILEVTRDTIDEQNILQHIDKEMVLELMNLTLYCNFTFMERAQIILVINTEKLVRYHEEESEMANLIKSILF